MRRRNQRGAVTAEFAAAVPSVVVLTLAAVWAVGLTAAQLRMVDAAREVARAVARGEGVAAAGSLGTRVAPSGTRFTVSREGDLVRVSATARVSPGVGPVGLPGVSLSAEAIAAAEDR